MKTKAIVIGKTGGPEVMDFTETEVPQPGAGEVLIKHSAIGINYIDIYHRTGLYPLNMSRFTPGLEAAGEIVKCGHEVDQFRPGQRVAYASPPVGAYSETRTMPADRLVPLPDSISDEQAASVMLKGLTAEYLLCRAYPVKKGQTILVHAAAGGVGQILCQWAKHLGATVIGTVGSEEKAETAKSCGCDYPVIYTEQDFLAMVMEYTGGEGVPVVYDSVGKDTFATSLECLSPRGTMVSFGQSSGPVPPFDISALSARGSLYLTRPTLMHYTADRLELLSASCKLFNLISTKVIKVPVSRKYKLKDAARAHNEMETRKTTGSGIFTV